MKTAGNWKYCNKIIFKYVNITVEPIFNEKVAEKVIVRALFIPQSQQWQLKKKKKKLKTQTWTLSSAKHAFQTHNLWKNDKIISGFLYFLWKWYQIFLI